MATPFMNGSFHSSPPIMHHQLPLNQQQPPFKQPPQPHYTHQHHQHSTAPPSSFPHSDFHRHPSNSGSDGSDASGRGRQNSYTQHSGDGVDDGSDGSDRDGSADYDGRGGKYEMDEYIKRSHSDDEGPGSGGPGNGSAVLAQTFYDPFRIKHRRRTSASQLKVLEYHFDRNPKPDVNLRKSLAEQLGMTPREVQVWFQNRRAKVKKLREKIDKEPGDEHSPVRSRSKPPLFSSSMGPMGPPIRMGSLPHDFISSARRGSSPAVLGSSPTLGYEPYYDNSPLVYNAAPHPLNHDRENPSSHFSLHPSRQPPPLPSPTLQPLASGYPSPSHSPNNDFRHLTTAAPPGGRYQEEQHNNTNGHMGGRRFSLPAYSSSTYPSPSSAWPSNSSSSTSSKDSEHFVSVPQSRRHPHPQHTSFASPPQYFPPPSNLYPSPLDINTDLDPRAPDYAYAEHPRDHESMPINEDYSPGSSGEDVQSPYEYPSSIPPSFIGGGSSFQTNPAFSQYTFGAKRSDHEESLSPFEYQSNNSTAGTSPGAGESFFPGFGPAGARRSSCPPGFLPQFDNLGINSSPPAPIGIGGGPTWTGVYASPSGATSNLSLSPSHHPMPISMQSARHSFAAPSPGAYPYGLSASSPYGLAPSPSLPIPNGTQAPQTPFPYPPTHLIQAANDRRGSVSNLDTIAEQPSSAQAYVDSLDSSEAQMHLQSPGTDRNNLLAARKARSQATLRGIPYPAQQERRSPVNAVAGQMSLGAGPRDRRGSATSLDFSSMDRRGSAPSLEVPLTEY